MPEPDPSRWPSNGHDLAKDLRDLLEAMRRGRWMIAIGVVACLTLGILYLAASKRVYQATARLLILQQEGRPLNVANSDASRTVDGEDYIPTHAAILRSPLVVGRAIEAIGARDLPSLAGYEDPTQEAIKRLTITRPDRIAKVLQVDYEAGSREEAVRVVLALTESYRKFLEVSYQKNNSEVVTLITRARVDLKAEMERMEQEYLQFRREHSMLMADETGRSYVARRLEQWDRAGNEAMVRAIQLKLQLELGKTLASKGTGLWAVAHSMSQIGGEQGGGLIAQMAGTSQAFQSDYVRQLSQEQQQLAERYGPQYSKVRELQDQIVRVQERTRESRSRFDQADSRDLLSAIEQGLEAVEAMRAEFGRRFDEDLAKAKVVEIDLLAEANLKGNLERHRSLFNTVVDQLKQAQLAGDYSRIAAEAIEPGHALPQPVRPRVLLTLILSVLAGCLVGAGAAVVSERLDLRVRTAEELIRGLDLTLLGLIPRQAEVESALSGELGRVSQALPRSHVAESYKALRTNIEMIRRNGNVRVILVTSPSSGDGKSTTASNLAIGLAQAGRRVLLIDADLRKPRQDQIHGLLRDRGFVHVLAGPVTLDSVVQRSGIENLDIVTVGPTVSNPAELLMSPRLAEVLDEARRSYDVVIIDSSPLQAVTDPSIVAAQADGVVLVVRLSATKQHDARRSAEILKALGTPILGVVINGVTSEHSAGYGYGYGYGSEVYGEDPSTDVVSSSPPSTTVVGFGGATPSPSVNGHHS